MLIDIQYQKLIRRSDLKKNGNIIYIFGDNIVRQGFGGQAKEMRGEPNAFGIATKAHPGTNNLDYFSDENPEHAILMVKDIGALFHLISTTGRRVVLPEDGIGTGLSMLPERAPRLYQLLYRCFAQISACPWAYPPTGKV